MICNASFLIEAVYAFSSIVSLSLLFSSEFLRFFVVVQLFVAVLAPSNFFKFFFCKCLLKKRMGILHTAKKIGHHRAMQFLYSFFKDAIDFVLSFTRCILRNSIFFCLRVCVCVCVCMCVCVYILSP